MTVPTCRTCRQPITRTPGGLWTDGLPSDPTVCFSASNLRHTPVEEAPPAPEFDVLLHVLLAQDAPHGWFSSVEGDKSSMCWFASARNAAAWVVGQSAERLGTPFEYVVRPATPRESPPGWRW